jgi:hypothetical protein
MQHVNQAGPNLEPASEESIRMAQAWLRECNQHHRGCAPGRELQRPTWLLDLGPRDSVKLIPSDGPEKYAALSYCWGGDQKSKLTKDRLGTAQSGMPDSSLPQTIQDAIHITRRLDLRFLWVDSLCITQDDSDEKFHEIRKMTDIFRGAHITISAASADSSAKGFLGSRKQVAAANDQSFKIRFCDPGGTSGWVILETITGKIYCDEPLNERAWTMQEHLLSSRVLFYGSRQLHFLCREKEAMSCDGGLLTVPPVADYLPSTMTDLSQAALCGQKDLVYDRWPRVVQEYSRRKMTIPTDKLIAISGIANEFHKILDDEYLAGLWKREFGFELLWSTVQHGETLMPRPSEYQAPSWSWASVDSEVHFPWARKRHGAMQAQLREAHLKLASPLLPFGAVTSGSVTLKARLKEADWYTAGLSRDGMGRIRTRHGSGQSSEPDLWGYADATDDLGPPNPETHVSQVWCLEISSPRKHERYVMEDIYGLLLLRNDDGIFKRVGTFGTFMIPFSMNMSETKADRRFFDGSDWEWQTVTIV